MLDMLNMRVGGHAPMQAHNHVGEHASTCRQHHVWNRRMWAGSVWDARRKGAHSFSVAFSCCNVDRGLRKTPKNTLMKRKEGTCSTSHSPLK